MNNLFQKASSPWVRYNGYEYKKLKTDNFISLQWQEQNRRFMTR